MFLLFLLSNATFALSQKWEEDENSASKKVNNIFDLGAKNRKSRDFA